MRHVVHLYSLRAERRRLAAGIERSRLGREELIVRQQVDRSPRRARKQVDQDVLLIRRVLGKKSVGCGLYHRVGIADRDDRARENSDLDRLWRAVSIEIRSLIGDIEVDVDRFTGKRRASREKRYFLRFSGPAIDDRAALQPAHHSDRSRFDVAEKRRDDEWYYSEHADQNGGDDEKHLRHES